MTLNKREAGNLPRWQPGRTGFYEVYFLMWQNVEKRQIGWIRHILNAPTQGAATASVWGAYLHMDEPARNIAIQQAFPIDQVRTGVDPFHFDIGASSIGQGTAAGAVSGGGVNMEWNLRFDAPGALVNHIPIHWGPFPRTKFVSPFCGGRLSGAVRIDGQELAVQNTPAVQSHFWGTKIVAAWVWGHCSSFREDPDFVFDGVWAQERIAGLTLSPITCLFFHWEGHTYSCNGLVQSLFGNSSRHDLYEWTFEAKSGDLMFRGKMTGRPGRKIIWTHRDPDGDERYGHLDLTADLRLDILRRSGNQWQLLKTLTAEQSATFEVSQPERLLDTGTVYPLINVPLTQ